MKAIFRCSLCGTELTNFLAEVDREVARDTAVQIATSNSSLIHAPHGYPASEYHPSMFYSQGIHECDDGSIGLVRFIGFKMEVEKEDSSEND